jgi:hypothetical protein
MRISLNTNLNIKIFALLLGLTIGFAGPVMARDVSLGSIAYDEQPESGVLDTGGSEGEMLAFVGGREGEFRGVRFEVRRSDVEVLDLRLVYRGGKTENVRIRQIFPAGSSSQLIELAEPSRALQEVAVNFVAKGPAHIEFFAVEGSGGGAD